MVQIEKHAGLTLTYSNYSIVGNKYYYYYILKETGIDKKDIRIIYKKSLLIANSNGENRKSQ